MQFPEDLQLSDLDKLRLECAVDQSLRVRLVQDPVAVLAERGIEVPEGVSIDVVEDTLQSHTITLPPYVGSDLSDDALPKTVGDESTWWCTTCTPTSPICMSSVASLTCLTTKA